MRAIVKGFVIGTLGLAVLIGSPAVSSAQPKPKIPRHDECHCTCQYDPGKEEGVFTFWPSPNPTSCTLPAAQSTVPWCKDQAGIVHLVPSKFRDCRLIQGIVSTVPVQPPVAR